MAPREKKETLDHLWIYGKNLVASDNFLNSVEAGVCTHRHFFKK